jgi:P4 family phage/plasmid primase-like protien
MSSDLQVHASIKSLRARVRPAPHSFSCMKKTLGNVVPKFNLENVPAELLQINNWILVQLVPRVDGGKDKVPVGINNAGLVHKLKWGTQSNLMSFEQARSHYQIEMSLPESSKRFHGIGFVLSDSGYLCVDLDKSVDNQALKPFAEEILSSLNGYVELSQSQTGHHIIVSDKGWVSNTKRGKFEDGSGIDLLSKGSYVMLTGDICEFTLPLTDEEQDFSIVRKWQDRFVGAKIDNKTTESVPFDHSIPLSGWTADRIRTEIFPRIPNFTDRDNWRDVGFALHNQFRGSQEGLDLFHEYSAQDPEIYDEKAVDDLWRSTKVDPKRRNKTLRWPLFLARNTLGWTEEKILGDLDNARLFKSMYEGEFLFCHARRKWLRYDGFRWVWCVKGEEVEAAKSISHTLSERAGELFKLDPNNGVSKIWIAHAKASRNSKRIEAMLTLASSEPGMSIASINELDFDGMLLGVANGIVNLSTGELTTPDPKFMMTKQVNSCVNNSATCPQWLRFMKQTFKEDQELIDYIQKALGYSLTGDVREEVLHFCFGIGSNGKSVMANVIQNLMGDYVVTANFDLLAVRESSATNDIARLAGARIVLANETKENQKLDDQKLKALVSTEMITARFLYGEHFEFKPQFKIWLRGNHKPIITDSSEGAWRRIRLVPFENQIPLDKRDYGLEEKLVSEKEGILNWLIEGCLIWQKERLTKIPQRIQDASDGYREESDVLGEFIEDCCSVDKKYSIDQKVLYSTWKTWCFGNGLQPFTQKSLTRQLTSRSFKTERRKENGVGVRYYLGLRLNDALQKEYDTYKRFE